MKGYAKWSALVLVGLLGCSDSVSKKEPVVVNLGENNPIGNPNNPDPNNPDPGNNPDPNNPDPTNNPDPNNPDNNPDPNNSPGAVIIDLRADTNRDGVLSWEDLTEDVGEDLFDSTSGAVFLPNIDDDSERCSRQGNDASLAACNDASDQMINGAEDLLDLAPIGLRVVGEIPDTATASLSADAVQNVRFFRRDEEGIWTAFDPNATTFAAEELRTGLEFRVEGLDVIRSVNGWDGTLNITATLNGVPEATESTDALQLKQAPLVLRHHLDPVLQIFSSELGIGGDGAFTSDLKAAVAGMGLEPGQHYELPVQDQWTQDFLESAYLMMPGQDDPQLIHVYIRSANIEMGFNGGRELRAAGRVVYTVFRGPNRAGLTQFTSQRSLDWDTLNSFGNTEVIPPHDGYPLGRIIRGEAPGDKGDARMLEMFSAQGVQTPLFVDTGWLLVAHIDETVSFIKDENAAMGWAMLANDATYAVQMLDTLANQGGAQIDMFQGKRWVSDFGREYSAAVSVSEVLNDPDIMGASAEAAVEVDAQVNAIKSASGLTDADIIYIPFTHMTLGGASIAHQPGIVNGIVMDDENYFAPDPHGPRVGGVDLLVQITEERLAARGFTVSWVEDWDMYHRLAGEIHCATNVTRMAPETTRWWEEI
jgi:protein-arginine deiminase